MLNQFFNQKNSIPAESNITWNTQGYSSMGMDVTGTFTSGSFVLQGTVDGSTWTTLETANASGLIDNGTITATGHFIFNILGFNLVKLVPSALSATIDLSVLGTVEVAAAFADSSGGDIVVDSLTINGVDNAALATDENGLVYGVTGVSGDVMRLSGTGTGELDQAIYTGARYVAVGANSSIFTSVNGTSNWLQRTSPASGQWFSIAWNGSLAVAVGALGIVGTSPDGITWTSRTSGVATNLASVTWDGTVFIAVGSSQVVVTSPDGITWTSRTFGTTVAIRGVASTSTLAVSVCAGGTIKTSTDRGVTWTSRTSGVATTLWKVAVNDLGTLWTAVGDSGVILTSPDGTTWTARTSGVGTTALNNVAFGNSIWMVVGDTGTILTSSNGTTWTAQTSGTTNNLYGSVYGTLWLALGNAIKTTSPDAVTWTAVSQFVWIASTPAGTGQLATLDGAYTLTGVKTFASPPVFSSLTGAATGLLTVTTTGVSGRATNIGIAYTWSAAQTISSTLSVASVMAVGTSIDSLVGFGVGGANLFSATASSIAGVQINPTLKSSTINRLMRLDFVNTGASSSGYALQIGAPTFGTSSPSTEYAAIDVQDQGASVFAIRAGTGIIKFASLAGTGSRTVVADANGVLSAP